MNKADDEKTTMTLEEAWQVLAEPLPSFIEAVLMPADEWHRFVQRQSEAAKIIRLARVKIPDDDDGCKP